MQEKNQSNLFIWISLVIMAAIIIGGVGLYFYLQGQKSTLENNGKNYQVAAKTTTQTTTETTAESTTQEDTTANETADWKTYTNNTYNYSIKYDTGWSVGNDKGKGSEPNRLSWVELQNKATFGDAAVVVEVSKNTYSDINAWVKAMNNNDLGATYTVEDSTVAGVSAKKLSTSAEGGAIRTGLIKGNNLYVIHLIYSFNQKEKNQLDLIYDKMLSTFKFIL